MTAIQKLEKILNGKVSLCSDEKIYAALTELINSMNSEKKSSASKKKLYYISAEFLIGKLLASNLINLGIYDEISAFLEENGKDLKKIEELEPEPSLGNGGLGRLAACFLDSIASLGLNGDGIGLCYHLGLFRQVFKNCLQTEEINPWIEYPGFLRKTDTSYKIRLGDTEVTSRLYDIDVTGCGTTTNKLHLFDIETVDESIVESGIKYDKTDIKKNLTLFLYPDDSDDNGRYLRIYQQYFMVSNAARFILDECEKRGCQYYDLPNYAVIQINDTHPALIIPELIRLLYVRGLTLDEAINAVTKTCAYTNHTILSEALEKWPLDFLKRATPQLIPIIEELDARIKRRFTNPSVYIIDENKNVHMAHIAIHYGFSINGVAALHTEILKKSELNAFYRIYPQKFSNKTNGITFRRWLTQTNPELDAFISKLIGDGFRKNSDELTKLLTFKNDKEVLSDLLGIKRNNKLRLKEYIYNTQKLEIDGDSVFDIQIKRLHEYKRQQLNLLYCINKYLEIKEGNYPKRPLTVIFGAKAAPSYTVAKDIIHLILCMQRLICKNPDVSKFLNIVMVENYNVTNAQKLIPACDISEQISLASKEASGTGNMKLMLNGAVTLGTADGANVEIHRLVGDDNIYIFGSDSSEVIARYKSGKYNPLSWYEASESLKRSVDFITGSELASIGCKENLRRLSSELLTKDWFMTFPDFDSYCKTKERAISDYENRFLWAEKMLVNIAQAGYFSSDRTIREYNRDIWKIGE